MQNAAAEFHDFEAALESTGLPMRQTESKSGRSLSRVMCGLAGVWAALSRKGRALKCETRAYGDHGCGAVAPILQVGRSPQIAGF